MRAGGAAALVVTALAAGTATGCGGMSQPTVSADAARTCLEQAGSDVIAPPLQEAEGLVFGLAPAPPSSSAFVGLPAGGVVAVGFFEADEDATRAMAAGVVSEGKIDPEPYRSALVVWQGRATQEDRDLLQSCLLSDDGHAEGSERDPRNPIGCVRVALAASATPAQRRALEREIRSDPLTRGVRFVPREVALERLRATQPELTENLHGNPLPDVYDVGPKRGEQARRLGDSLRGAPGVESVGMSSLPCALGN